MSSKIGGKFYPLQHEEWVRACKELNPSQRDVLYYLRTLDPYGSGLKVNCAEVARQLSSPQRKVNRSTVSRAIRDLCDRGFIDAEALEYQVQINPKGLLCGQDVAVTQHGCDSATPAIVTQHLRSPRNACDRDATPAIATQQPEPETPTEPESQNAKIIKTIKTLSEAEREAFLEFGRKKAAQLPHPPELPDKWIEAHFEDLHRQFLGSPAGRTAKKQAIAQQYDWENVPHFDDWLKRAFYEGMVWVQENEAEREQRYAFFEWAQTTDAYKGRVY